MIVRFTMIILSCMQILNHYVVKIILYVNYISNKTNKKLHEKQLENIKQVEISWLVP